MTELRKHIPVDVFGKCGNPTNCTRKCYRKKGTLEIIRNYKFYFVAENSVSKDYFTGRVPLFVRPLIYIKQYLTSYLSITLQRSPFAI